MRLFFSGRTGARKKRVFPLEFREIVSRCEALECFTGKSAGELAFAYMQYAWSKRDDLQWWRENGAYAREGWFILEALRKAGLAEAAKPPVEMYCLKCRERILEMYAFMSIQRDTDNSEKGMISIRAHCFSEALCKMLRQYGYWFEKDAFIRKIGETAGRIEDRATEIGCVLLENGADLYLRDRRVFQGIQTGEYEREHRYWVDAGDTDDKLIIRMPWDKEMYAHVAKAGGKWVNRRIELPVKGYDTFEDIAVICGFRVTEEARKRIFAWREAEKRAVLYKERPGKGEKEFVSVEEAFRTYMSAGRGELSDLYETDDE